MLTIIEGFPDNVVAFVATGRVTAGECDTVLLPAIAKCRRRHDKLRLYYELECRYPGAAWEDLDIAPLRLQPWERVALVTDVSWVRHTVQALRFLIPAEVRVFPDAAGRRKAAEWIIHERAPSPAPHAAPLASTGAAIARA